MHAIRKHRWQLVSEWPPHLEADKFEFDVIPPRSHEANRNQWASDGFRRVPYKEDFIMILPSWFETVLEDQCHCEDEARVRREKRRRRDQRCGCRHKKPSYVCVACLNKQYPLKNIH